MKKKWEGDKKRLTSNRKLTPSAEKDAHQNIKTRLNCNLTERQAEQRKKYQCQKYQFGAILKTTLLKNACYRKEIAQT